MASDPMANGPRILTGPPRLTCSDMIDQQDLDNLDEKGIAVTLRVVNVIDPNKTIRLIFMYHVSSGCNSAEPLRIIDTLQAGDKKGVTTSLSHLPCKEIIEDWQIYDDVMASPSMSTEDVKKEKEKEKKFW